MHWYHFQKFKKKITESKIFLPHICFFQNCGYLEFLVLMEFQFCHTAEQRLLITGVHASWQRFLTLILINQIFKLRTGKYATASKFYL